MIRIYKKKQNNLKMSRKILTFEEYYSNKNMPNVSEEDLDDENIENNDEEESEENNDDDSGADDAPIDVPSEKDSEEEDSEQEGDDDDESEDEEESEGDEEDDDTESEGDDEEESEEEESEDSDEETELEEKIVSEMVTEAYDKCVAEAIAYEQDDYPDHTVEGYMKENAALVASLAAKAMEEAYKTVKEGGMTVEMYEANCNSMKEAYAKKIDEMMESWDQSESE